ncbi:ABC transporter permease [Nocardioides sp. Bht2]|uniref:ABC transporter permease n=1 Tax=Nocardioides sp. Bht2 TaxID=3392297 RepID=UPI0039B446AD
MIRLVDREGLVGLRVLLPAFLRRDALMIGCWTVGIALLYWSQAVGVKGLYTSQADFDRAAATMENNAALIAMAGPARALNTVGGQVTWQAAAFGAIAAGLMSMFLIGRHTRAEEETGRDELLRSAVVGRQAPQTAALLVALIANLAVGLGVGLSLWLYGLPGTGSLASGLQVGLSGALFAGVALVAAQLTQNTRGMYGWVGLTIGVAYGLRAVGDVSNPALSWLSPIGWGQAMWAFSGDRFWPAWLFVAALVIVVAAAFAIFEHRDIGSGVVAARPGPAEAGRTLQGAFGLAWREQRGTFYGWSLGVFVSGLAYGSIGNDAAAMLGDSQLSEAMLAAGMADPVDGFLATSAWMLALIGAGFAISSALRPRVEESAGRVEALLATALPRGRWFAAHGAVTVLGTVAIGVAGALGLGIGFGLVTSEWNRWGDFLVNALSMSLASLVWVGLARLLYGISARWAPWAWAGLAFSVVVMLFGEVLSFPGWLMDLSPYRHPAQLPIDAFAWPPVVALGAVVAGLWVAGQAAFARRDVH